MIRKIIKIDNEKCDGCGLCINHCHESALEIKNNKAVLLRDDYCDGLGDCLPHCPQNAISFEQREADDFNEVAVKENQSKLNKNKILDNKEKKFETNRSVNKNDTELIQWPVQIKLVPTKAIYFENADILVAADCSAFAYKNFHEDFMKNKVTIVGCPKLDATDYSIKISEIIENNNVKSITVVRMQVPCCGGIEYAVKSSIEKSEKNIYFDVITISVDGKKLK